MYVFSLSVKSLAKKKKKASLERTKESHCINNKEIALARKKVGTVPYAHIPSL